MQTIACGAALACALLAPAVVRAADNELTAQEKAAGWRLLFDGKTFANWEDPTKKSPPGDSFTIDDGCLKATDRKSTRLNSSHLGISYAVFCLKKKIITD